MGESWKWNEKEIYYLSKLGTNWKKFKFESSLSLLLFSTCGLKWLSCCCEVVGYCEEHTAACGLYCVMACERCYNNVVKVVIARWLTCLLNIAC